MKYFTYTRKPDKAYGIVIPRQYFFMHAIPVDLKI